MFWLDNVVSVLGRESWEVLVAAFVLLDNKLLVMQQDLHPGWKGKPNVLKREEQVNGSSRPHRPLLDTHSGLFLTCELSSPRFCCLIPLCFAS